MNLVGPIYLSFTTLLPVCAWWLVLFMLKEVWTDILVHSTLSQTKQKQIILTFVTFVTFVIFATFVTFITFVTLESH